jgi:hypothetical protein
MVFIISLFVGFFLGYKLKGAIILFKEAKNIKYIEAVVNKVLSNKELNIYKSAFDERVERENDRLEKEHYIKMKIKNFKGVSK